MKNKLKWYHYAAKIFFMILTLPASPILILIALSSGDHPFALYTTLWNEGKD